MPRTYSCSTLQRAMRSSPSALAESMTKAWLLQTPRKSPTKFWTNFSGPKLHHGCQTRRSAIFWRRKYRYQMSESHLRANRGFLSRHARAPADRGGAGRLHLPVRPEPALDRQGPEPESSGYLAGTADE